MAVERCSPAEFAQRWTRVQAFLQEQDLGGLLAYSPPKEHKWGQTGHVSYLSGWDNHDRIVDSAVVVPARGEPALLLAGMPYMLEQIAEVSCIRDLRLVEAVDPHAVAAIGEDGAPRTFAGQTRTHLGDNGLDGKGVGVVGIDNMSAPFYETLARELGSHFARIPDIVAQLRAIKSPAEVALMRQAARLSDLGFQTMLEVARPGMQGIELVAEMERAVRLQGADHAKYWMASGPPPDWASTRLDLKPHERVLQEGDLMASCSYVLYKGYWCHGHRTGTLVRPSRELDQWCTLAREAQDTGLAEIKTGVPIGAIGRAIRAHAEPRGLGIQGGRYGHGMGMDYAELPALAETTTTPIEPGMTFVVHASYELPVSGKMFVPLGDVCHVNEKGTEKLMEFPRTPFVAGQANG